MRTALLTWAGVCALAAVCAVGQYARYPDDAVGVVLAAWVSGAGAGAALAKWFHWSEDDE